MELRLIVDLEADNLLPKVTRIHCIVTKDIDTGEVRRFRHGAKKGSTIEDGLKYIAKAEIIVGHNLVGYDLEAIKKLYPGFIYRGDIFDTLIVSCLIFTNLKEVDGLQRRIPPQLWGLHKLEAWGHRLGTLKGTYGKQENAWDKWSQEMEDYCELDVQLTHALARLLQQKNYADSAIELEHDFKKIIVQQEIHGIRIDLDGANKLTAQLQAARAVLTEKLRQVFPAKVETMKTPAYYTVPGLMSDFPTKGAALKACREAQLPAASITAGPLRTKDHLFNPASRDQIADRLKERYDWKPKKFTDTGKAQIDEGILALMKYPEAPLLTQYLVTEKTLGQLAEGKGAVMKLASGDRVHGSVFTNGAVTGRCTHSKPNMAQTPSVTMMKGADGKKAPLLGLDGGFGWEFRSLYLADVDQVLVGWDASGLELRCLAHFLAMFDGGAFGKVLLEGDVHTTNQNAAGLFLRDSAKTFIYAFLYGAGDEKIGSIVRQDAIDAGKPIPKGTLRDLGAGLRARFLKNFPALGRLKKLIDATLAQRPYLIGLDGRMLHVRSKHAALNTLLQSAGAILMKKACVFQHQFLTEEKGYVFHRDFSFVLNIHDEIQATCLKAIAEIVGQSGPASLKKAGEFFDFQCRLDGEYKIGPSWAATH